MIPVTFDDCFGWLHRGRGTTGAVLCGPFGQEGAVAYRGWLECAAGLAVRGLHVLRFDYPGTGDSAGTEDDPGRLDAWRRGVRAAVTFLRAATETETVILVGLRLGGALALLEGSELDEIKAVACLMPVVSGRTYLRELRLLASAWRDANLLPAPARETGGLEAVGDRLTAATLDDLARLDLRQVTRAPPQVLLMVEAAYPGIDGLAAHLRSLGSAVSMLRFPEATGFLQDSLASDIPSVGFKRLWDWCERFRSEKSDQESRISPRVTAWASLSMPDAQEEAFRFGADDGLFGVLCTPTGGRAVPQRTVVMVNTGFGRRIGDGRVYVTLARRLASIGVASLRLDMAGFGDSALREGKRADPYAVGCAEDIIAAIDALERAGYGSPILVGICSGAHAAYYAAIEDERVRGLIIVNLQKFIWKKGSSLKVENRRQRRPASFYLRVVGARAAWRRLLTGEVAVLSIGKALMSRPFVSAYREVCLSLETLTGWRTEAGRIMRNFRALSARGTSVDLIYSAGDPGLSELARHTGLRARRLRTLPNIGLRLIDAADHALLDASARSQFVDFVVDRLRDVAKTVAPLDRENVLLPCETRRAVDLARANERRLSLAGSPE